MTLFETIRIVKTILNTTFKYRSTRRAVTIYGVVIDNRRIRSTELELGEKEVNGDSVVPVERSE